LENLYGGSCCLRHDFSWSQIPDDDNHHNHRCGTHKSRSLTHSQVSTTDRYSETENPIPHNHFYFVHTRIMILSGVGVTIDGVWIDNWIY
jgi:hypothetical protein